DGNVLLHEMQFQHGIDPFSLDALAKVLAQNSGFDLQEAVTLV
nr:t-complex polypeptide 1 homolog (peak 1 fraction) - rabbit (fragments) [Oryctolagus cuniculus]